MGVLKLYASIVFALHTRPTWATAKSLDEIVSDYGQFAYIGSRKTLSRLVRECAVDLQRCIVSVTSEELDHLSTINRDLADALKVFKKKSASTKFDPASEWFGQKRWQTNSGVFPDFLLGLDSQTTFGNGALLELKDSRGDAIASFNSTIPTRYKSLAEVKHISGSSIVAHAAQLFDYPLSVQPNYLTRQRVCFYLVRTRSSDKTKVRLALVEGSFFETLPKDQLLEQVWGQILAESGMPVSEQPSLIEYLARLEQTDIARSREIEKASIKPRFRIMAEVHSDANIHAYPEIPPRTVNLILKRESDYDESWLIREMHREGFERVHLQPSGTEKVIALMDRDTEIHLHYLTITHKRNGEHIVLQYKLPK